MANRFLRRWMPSREALHNNRSLRWLGPLLRRPWLWQWNRTRVARGATIGVFFGFLIPIGQIPASAIVSIALRAHLPVAALSTLISNPFTYAPIWVLAYRTGAAMLGDPVDEARALALAEGADLPDINWLERIGAIGEPLFLGLFVFAVIGAAATWILVHLAWSVAVRLRHRRRSRRGTR